MSDTKNEIPPAVEKEYDLIGPVSAPVAAVGSAVVPVVKAPR